MDKEDVGCVCVCVWVYICTCICVHTHMHNGILLNHKKEKNYAICRDMHKPRDFHRLKLSHKL